MGVTGHAAGVSKVAQTSDPESGGGTLAQTSSHRRSSDVLMRMRTRGRVTPSGRRLPSVFASGNERPCCKEHCPRQSIAARCCSQMKMQEAGKVRPLTSCDGGSGDQTRVMLH